MTRYQGSKRRLLPWLWECLAPLSFDTVLDLFSGTSAFSYLCKTQGKQVTANDYLRCNQHIAPLTSFIGPTSRCAPKRCHAALAIRPPGSAPSRHTFARPPT